MFKWLRENIKPTCDSCGDRLQGYIFDFDQGRVLCPNCKNPINPDIYFDTSTANNFAKSCPDNTGQEFLNKLGWIERRPNSLLKFLGILSLIISASLFLLFIYMVINPIVNLRGIISYLIYAIFFLFLYSQSKKTVWQKKGSFTFLYRD